MIEILKNRILRNLDQLKAGIITANESGKSPEDIQVLINQIGYYQKKLSGIKIGKIATPPSEYFHSKSPAGAMLEGFINGSQSVSDRYSLIGYDIIEVNKRTMVPHSRIRHLKGRLIRSLGELIHKLSSNGQTPSLERAELVQKMQSYQSSLEQETTKQLLWPEFSDFSIADNKIFAPYLGNSEGDSFENLYMLIFYDLRALNKLIYLG